MSSIAYYFAGLATLPLLVIVLNRVFPRMTVDNRCVFCKRIKRCDSYEAAELDAKEHMAVCDKHPLGHLLTACKALQSEAASRGCGLRIADEAIARAEGTDA